MATQHWLRSSVSALVILTLVGCETVQNVANQASDGLNSLFTDAYLADKTDACYAQRSELSDHAEPLIADEIWQGALAGAATGAIGALILGENPLVGALVGGALGAAGGYLVKLHQDGRSPFQIVSTATEDVRKRNQEIDALLASFNRLSDCRKREARVIRQNHKNGGLTADEARAEMTLVRTRFDEDLAKFRELAEEIAEGSEGFAAIYNEVAAQNGRNELQVKEYKRGQKRSATVTPKKATPASNLPDGSLMVSNQRPVQTLQNECITNVEKRDDCFEAVDKAEADKNGDAFSTADFG